MARKTLAADTEKKLAGKTGTTAVEKVVEKTETAAVEKTAEKTETVAAGKQTAEKKTSTRKPAAKKAPAKKEASVEAKTALYVQFAGKQFAEGELVDAAKKAYEALGNKASDIKTLDIYVKLEESAAYYVVNGVGSDSFKIEL